MSRAGSSGSEEIGAIRIGVHMDTAPLKQGLAEAKAEATKAGAAIGGAIGQGASEAGQKLEDAETKTRGFIEGLRGIQRGVRQTVGAFLGWTAVIGTVGTALVGLIATLQAAWNALVTLGEKADVTARILRDPLLKVIEDLSKRDTIINVSALAQDIALVDKLSGRIAELQVQLADAGKRGPNLSEQLRAEELATLIASRADAQERLNRADRESKKLKAEEEAAKRGAENLRDLDDAIRAAEEATRERRQFLAELNAAADEIIAKEQALEREREHAREKAREEHEEQLRRIDEIRRRTIDANRDIARSQLEASGVVAPGGVGVTDVSTILGRQLRVLERIDSHLR